MTRRSPALVFGAICAILFAAGTAHAIEQPKLTQRASAEQPVTFDIYMPIQKQAELDSLLKDLHNPNSPEYHHWITPQQFHQRFSPSAAALQSAKDELTASGFVVNQITPRRLQVTGTVGTVEHVFASELSNGTMQNGKRVVAATRPLTLTPALESLQAVVANFSPAIHMHSDAKRRAVPDNRYSAEGPYWFTDLKQAYGWPSYKNFSGQGTTIGILMTGAFNPKDMDLYFGHEKLKTPRISEVKVDGGAPFDPDNSFETHLDIQQAAGIAPNAHIILYNIPDLFDSSIEDGLSQILEDNIADVVNMSFSGPELFFTPNYNGGENFSRLVFFENDLFKQGNAQGITFVSSSGDQGALPAPAIACFDKNATSTCGSFLLSAEFPASSPYVTGVGGTNLITTAVKGSLNSAYVRESAFGDPLDFDIFFGTPATGGIWGSGGGDSIYFNKPSFQKLVDTGSARRAVPDLALHMGGCPFGATQPCNPDDSSVIVAIGGKFFLVIGTSASSPDFAGLIALTVERFGSRLGNANEYIYGLSAAQNSGGVRVFRKSIPGFNGFYASKPGYNRVLGNGTVEGKNFLLAPQIPPAGLPQTPTNP